jgi:negative regulator of replication initiation
MDDRLDPDLSRYLRVSAAEAGISVSDLLRRVLHLDSKLVEFRDFFGDFDDATGALLAELDYRL